MKPVKIVVVGDGAVGKTCMCITYANNAFPPDYIPTIFDNYSTTTEVNGTMCALTLWDTAGQEEYDRLRPLSYPNTDIFFVCYSVVSSNSFINVTQKWIPEIKHHAPNAAIVIIGTKTDLRFNEEKLSELMEAGMKPLKFEQGLALSKEVGALRYFECSALTSSGLNDVFVESIEALFDKPVTKKDAKKCLIL